MTTPPSSDVLFAPPPTSADARLAYGLDPLQFGDLRLPEGPGPHPIVVVVHGGYWQAVYNLIHTGHLCVDLALDGVATWNVEYRRIGDPGGGWPGTLDDVVAAVEHVRRLASSYPLDLRRVIAMGHSAGGHLALLAALRARLRLRAIISLAGVVDLAALHRSGNDNGAIQRFLGGTPDERPDAWHDASPRVQLPLGMRYLLACGTADVHWAPNEETAAAARAAGDDVELLALEGAGHFELIDPATPEWLTVRANVHELLNERSLRSTPQNSLS